MALALRALLCSRASAKTRTSRLVQHHVAGHRAAHPDKAGRPRNDRTNPNRGTPQPLTPNVDNGPGSDKQHSWLRARTSALACTRRRSSVALQPGAVSPDLRSLHAYLHPAKGLDVSASLDAKSQAGARAGSRLGHACPDDHC